jgi:predicted O-methyltransferase YrrM
MKNCIFVCVFLNEKYIQLFFLFLESLYIYGNLTDDVDILVYTSSAFEKKIRESHLFSESVRFEVNDTINTLDTACKARLDLFLLPSVKDYDKILYLDVDMLIKDNIDKVFDLVTEDVLYVLEEGTIEHYYWGKDLFGDTIHNYEDKTAFSSGLLLFRRCERIMELFADIQREIKKRSVIFYDQPYIVCGAFQAGAYNNKILKSFAVNQYNDSIHPDKVIYHFPGGPGDATPKLERMSVFFQRVKENTMAEKIKEARGYIDTYLLPIVHRIGEPLEGNIFMFHHTTTYTDKFHEKVQNIATLVLNKKVQNVLEIGFNAGFSTLLMLLCNPNVHITCADLGEHAYTRPCFDQLKETFGDRIHLIVGDSRETLPQIHGTFDLIHIDGGHSTAVARNDIIQSYRLARKGAVLIMDDYDFCDLHTLWDEYVESLKLQPLDIHVYPSPHHDIRYRFQ